MVRLFIAIPLPAEMRARVHAAAASFREAAPALAWAGPERLHLTVRFLGSTSATRVPPLAEALAAVAPRHVGVPLVLRGAGAFPTLRRIRVVWAGVEPDPRLELLQHDVESACERLGFGVEARPFRPHVTLGRARLPIQAATAGRLARAVEAFAFEEEGIASSLDLMQSSFTPQGVAHRCLASAPLRAG